jgi:hypothetical protein
VGLCLTSLSFARLLQIKSAATKVMALLILKLGKNKVN